MVWHQETALPPTDLVVLPGGFSYGDYLRCGSMASKSKVMHEVIKHAEKGGYLFGICNGFQILTETNLLPGALLRNNKLKFICKDVFVKTVNNRIPFTKKIPDQKVLSIPIAHNEGNYFANEDQIKELQDNQQIVFQYCDKQGNISLANNPNGSLLNIAGITNKHKNILGMMPHPERVIDTLLGGIDGEGIFQSLL